MRALNKCECHNKEAKTILGLSDIYGCINGHGFILECKKSAKSRRSKLQEYRIKKFKDAGGYAEFVYPENMDRIIKEIEQLGSKPSCH